MTTSSQRAPSSHRPVSSRFSAGFPDNVPEPRVRARDLGISPGILPPGLTNSITDVPGVRVGHVTLATGPSIRTGVTAVLPHGGNMYDAKVPAALYVANGFGKLIGSTQLDELGVLESPIVLTNTLSVWRAAEAVAEFVLGQEGNEGVQSINVVVGETNDGLLNDIRGMHVQKTHVIDALRNATCGPVKEGCIGAGTGTVAFGFKGGIGSSSRLIAIRDTEYILGVLVQTNFGGVLTIDGLPIGRELASTSSRITTGDGSIMIVLASDMPLDSRQLKRIAKRAMLGVSRTGSSITHGSGDYALAFSVASLSDPEYSTISRSHRVQDGDLSPTFQAAVEATEEAIYNSLLMARTTCGHRGQVVEALPLAVVHESILRHAYDPRPFYARPTSRL